MPFNSSPDELNVLSGLVTKLFVKSGRFDSVDMPQGGSVLSAFDHTGYACHIKDNQIAILEITTEQQFEITVNCYGGEIYSSLESFVRRAGDDARFRVDVNAYGDRVASIYDGGEITPITTTESGRELSLEEQEGWYSGGNFGYAFNLDHSDNSEWGIMSQFPMNNETPDQAYERSRQNFQNILDLITSNGTVDATIINEDGVTHVLKTFIEEDQS